MGMRRRVVGVGVFVAATALASGIAIAARPSPPTSAVATGVAYVPVGDPMPADPSMDDRIARLIASTDPGPLRDRLELITRLAEIGPGGSRADAASREGAGIVGIAIDGDGIVVVLTSDAVRTQSAKVVDREIGAIVAAHPSLAHFGTVRYELRDLSVVADPMAG